MEAYVAVNGQLVARSPADDLLARLEEPQVLAALNNLLNHADLLSMLVVSLDGFLSRGDVIADSLSEAIGDFRGVAGGNPAASFDAMGLMTTVGKLGAATPAINAVLTSMTDPRAIDVVTALTDSVAEARENAAKAPAAPTGIFGLMRALKDEDVSRGLGFMIEVAKAFGQRLKSS